MHISQKGIELIKQFEGCRLKAYKCPAGIWTIGYGHTGGVYQGMHITYEQAEEYLRKDLERFESFVNMWSGYNWNQNEFDALVSFTFNCGNGNLTQLLQKGSRPKDRLPIYIRKYNKAGGVVLAGLTRRREAEATLFESPLWDNTGLFYYPAYSGNSIDLDVMLRAIGASADLDGKARKKYQKRIPIAVANGISDYRGTGEQNTLLKKLCREGKLKRP